MYVLCEKQFTVFFCCCFNYIDSYFNKYHFSFIQLDLHKIPHVFHTFRLCGQAL